MQTKNLSAKLKREKAEITAKDFEDALNRLKEASVQPPTEFNQDSTIKRFEFTFEMAWKLMKVLVELEGLEAASPKRSIRQAAVIELITEPEIWFKFLDSRNLTAHTYKERIARQVYQSAKEFIPYAENLLKSVKEYLSKI